ncbi:MAG: HIT family protein [Nanoarchaeota archaeon]|nr:HIT family protein [DPANN group archaeon]MBL7116430.1 HIT family protein [Nanoarchaeota archaeon]
MKRELLDEKERVLYEDDIAVAILVKEPAAKGHILILPKKEAKYIEDLSEDDLEHIFHLANYTATVLFESLGAQGTNVITTEGEEFYIEVIARKQGDDLNFQWKPKQLPTNEMDSVVSSISSNMVIGKQKEEPKHPPKIEDQPEDIIGEDEDSYLLEQLKRIP